MRPEVLMVFVLFGVTAAVPFQPGPRFKQILDDAADLRGEDRGSLLEQLEKELGLDDVQHLSVERHQLLVPPSLVVQLCLQDAVPVWTQLQQHEATCPHAKDHGADLDLACMLGKWAVASGPEEDAGAGHEQLGPALLQCRDWWRLAQRAGRTAEREDAELGRCLLQAVSVACHPKMDTVIKSALQRK